MSVKKREDNEINITDGVQTARRSKFKKQMNLLKSDDSMAFFFLFQDVEDEPTKLHFNFHPNS